MRIKFPIPDSVLTSSIEESYSIQVKQLEFLPKGDISYAYIITSTNGEKFFLKLFDKNTSKIGLNSSTIIVILLWNILTLLYLTFIGVIVRIVVC